MPFRFPLATVLRYRETVKKQEERALQKILAEIARKARQIEELTSRIENARDAVEQTLRKPTPAIHVQMIDHMTQATREERMSLVRDLQTLEQQRVQQLKVFHAAHRNCETLIDLFDKQRVAYEQEQGRIDQKKQDDIVVSRHQRS